MSSLVPTRFWVFDKKSDKWLYSFVRKSKLKFVDKDLYIAVKASNYPDAILLSSSLGALSNENL